MAGMRKTFLIFFFISIQTILATASGMLVLDMTTRNMVQPGVYIGTVDIGKMSFDNAVEKTKSFYKNIIKDKSLVIDVNHKKFEIRYSDIGANIDYNATFAPIYGKKPDTAFENLINGYFSSRKRVLLPVVKFDRIRLKEKIDELSSRINREPVNANIYLKDGRIVKTPAVTGIRLNTENAVTKISNEIVLSFDRPLEFKDANHFEIETVSPDFSSGVLEGIDDIISSYSTYIKQVGDMGSIELAVSSINRILIYPEGTEKAEKAGVFSFNEQLAGKNGIMEQNNEGYNQVASTLFAAVLTAGVEPDSITRTPHRTPADYFEPGLDAIVYGNTVDFKFKNTLHCKLVIFAYIKDGRVTVDIAGKKKAGSDKYILKSEIVQKFDPPVINIEDSHLQPGRKILVSPGRQGVKVNVYGITEKNGVETGRELIHTDEYKAAEVVIHVGPSAETNNGKDAK